MTIVFLIKIKIKWRLRFFDLKEANSFSFILK